MIHTEHFSFEEFILSPTAIRHGIDNNPPNNVLPDILRTMNGLEKIRSVIGLPIRITSGYRCEALNRLVGSHKSSQHIQGRAADIISPRYGNAFQLAKAISEEMDSCGVDKLILEFGRWVHVSFTAIPRKEIYTIRSVKEGYVKGLMI
jgi:hypothetical protein